MATLSTNTTQLQQINRRRQMADALAMQAMATQPIQSPWQGAAKLAQAWVAAKMMKGATKQEEEMAQEQRDRLSAALDQFFPATTLTVPEQQQFLPGVQNNILGGFDQDYRGVEMPVPDQFKEMKIQHPMAEIMRNMDPQYAEQAIAQIGTQYMMSGLGLTPQAEEARYRAPQKLSDWERKRDMVLAIDPDGQLGVLGPFMLNGNIDMKNANWLPAGSQNPFSVAMINGIPFHLNPKSPLGIGNKVEGPGTVIGRTQQANSLDELISGGDFGELYQEAVGVMDNFGQIETLIQMGGLSPDDTGIGMARSFGMNMIGSLNQIGAMMGWQEFKVRGGAKDTGQLANYQNYEGYTPTEEDYRKYGKEGVEENMAAWRKLAGIDAATYALGISLAYTLARIADPGGRLSEMDVMNQIKKLQLDSSSIPVRMAAIERAKREFAVRIKTAMTTYRMGGRDLKLPEGFESGIDDIIRTTDINSPHYSGWLTGTPTEAETNWNQTPTEVKTHLEDIMLNGTPEQKRQLEQTMPYAVAAWRKYRMTKGLPTE